MLSKDMEARSLPATKGCDSTNKYLDDRNHSCHVECSSQFFSFYLKIFLSFKIQLNLTVQFVSFFGSGPSDWLVDTAVCIELLAVNPAVI